MQLGASAGELGFAVHRGARGCGHGIARGRYSRPTFDATGVKVLIVGVRPTDPFTFTAVIALLACHLDPCCYIPAPAGERVGPDRGITVAVVPVPIFLLILFIFGKTPV